MMRNDRVEADPDQWRALMGLPDADLMSAWHQATQACELARRQGSDLDAALRWRTLIEGAAASRFGVGQHLDRYRAAYGDL